MEQSVVRKEEVEACVWIWWTGGIPMYHPCARKMRRKNVRRRTTVPIQRYVAKGVLLSR